MIARNSGFRNLFQVLVRSLHQTITASSKGEVSEPLRELRSPSHESSSGGELPGLRQPEIGMTLGYLNQQIASFAMFGDGGSQWYVQHKELEISKRFFKGIIVRN